MGEEYEQVHTTSQEAEPTQPDVTEELDQSTSETESEQGEAEPAGNTEEGKDPNDWALKRIGALTAKAREAERLAQSKTGEAERYRLLLEQYQRGETPDVVTGTKEPDIDELVNRRAAELSQQKALAERGNSVAKTGAELFPDFTGAVENLDAIGITNEQVQSLLGLDDAHKVIYALGKNPEEAMRILSLPPLQQGRELDRLASKVGQKEPQAVSKAPAPIKAIDGTRATANADPDKMSTDEWMAWRAKNAKTRF